MFREAIDCIYRKGVEKPVVKWSFMSNIPSIQKDVKTWEYIRTKFQSITNEQQQSQTIQRAGYSLLTLKNNSSKSLLRLSSVPSFS